MRMKFFFSILAIPFMFGACGNLITQREIQPEKLIIHDSLGKEEFHSFFYLFGKDSTFQFSRVNFPLQMYTAIWMDEKGVTHDSAFYVNIDEWNFINLVMTENSSSAFIINANDVICYLDNMHTEFFGHVKCNFENINNKWYLASLREYIPDKYDNPFWFLY